MTTLPRLISDCQGKIDRGSCSTPIQMWAYDKKKGRCLPFTYGGCGGNLNRFFSRDQCQQTCEETSISTTKTTEKSLSVTTTSELKYVIKTKSACLRPRVRLSLQKTCKIELKFFLCCIQGGLFSQVWPRSETVQILLLQCIQQEMPS